VHGAVIRLEVAVLAVDMVGEPDVVMWTAFLAVTVAQTDAGRTLVFSFPLPA
jgi:hypothetical protein